MPPAAASEAVRSVLDAPSHPQVRSGDWARWKDAVATLYAERGFNPLWFEGRTHRTSAIALLAELGSAETRGLVAEDYSAQGLAEAVHELSSIPGDDPSALVDVALSVTALRFASELNAGRVDPRTLGFELDAERPPLDAVRILRLLADASDAGEVAGVFDALEPKWRRTALLKQALAKYRSLAARAPFIPVERPARWNLSVGDAYAGAPELRRLLASVGDLPESAGEGNFAEVLDTELAAALARFQGRHGLHPSGRLDESTHRALSVPLARRVRQIELTLERLRWLPPKLDNPPIVVNIPQFRLFAFYTVEDREESILPIDVIVGQAFARHNTPVFAADMTHVIFQPYWDVPYSILVRELLPDIRKSPGWVRNKGYEIVWKDGTATQQVDARVLAALRAGEARLRQRPGPTNALGRVKFVFPNRHNVGLHDTPATALFAEARRDFSHGCIRVADPVGLAEYVLRENPGWNRARVAQAMRATTPERVYLVRPIRVFILYATALAAEDGSVHFFEDLYGQDDRLEAALELPPAVPRFRTSPPLGAGDSQEVLKCSVASLQPMAD